MSILNYDYNKISINQNIFKNKKNIQNETIDIFIESIKNIKPINFKIIKKIKKEIKKCCMCNNNHINIIKNIIFNSKCCELSMKNDSEKIICEIKIENNNDSEKIICEIKIENNIDSEKIICEIENNIKKKYLTNHEFEQMYIK